MNKPVLFSFFSGSGFLDLGFEKNGFHVHFVNEYHVPFLDAYKYSRHKLKTPEPKFGYSDSNIESLVYGEESHNFSCKVLAAKNDGELVGFIGGPPCPDFSVGGKNKGKDGENGKLTRVYVEAIIKYKPDFFIFENVKGLWRTKAHREFYDSVKKLLCEAGYLLTDRLTNCIEYGAPQDRDRILLFGIHTSVTSTKTNEDLGQKFNWLEEIKFNRESVLNKNYWPSRTPYKESGSFDMPPELKSFEELTVEYWFKKNDVMNHPNTNHYFTPRAALPRFQSIDEGDDSKKSFKRLHRWRYSPTAAYGNNEVHLHPYFSRRISAAEALAIQSLPKEFELPPYMTLSNMFKTIGNGVPFLASSGLAKTVLKYLNLYANSRE